MVKTQYNTALMAKLYKWLQAYIYKLNKDNIFFNFMGKALVSGMQLGSFGVKKQRIPREKWGPWNEIEPSQAWPWSLEPGFWDLGQL